MGRRKIEIKKLENLRNRKVTFKKRRDGILKKARELAILTDSKVTLSIKNGDALENHVFNDQVSIHAALPDALADAENDTMVATTSDIVGTSQLDEESIDEILVVPHRPDLASQWPPDPTSMDYDQSLDFLFEPLALSISKPCNGYELDFNPCTPFNFSPENFGHPLLPSGSSDDLFLGVQKYEDCDWLSSLLEFNTTSLVGPALA